MVCADTGDALTNAKLDALDRAIGLGVHRLRMHRGIGVADAAATRRVRRLARDLVVDVVHGHGAKGGAYARLASVRLPGKARPYKVFYTPHGGSLHFAATSPAGRLVLALERRLDAMTDGLIFESRFASERYRSAVGVPRSPTRVVPNGVAEADFEPVTPADDATDLLFIGELRQLKGVDVLLRAIHALGVTRPTTATIVGAGPDEVVFRTLAHQLGLDDRVRFMGAMPARAAFTLGRLLVVPSRAESLPYIVLEAGAAAVPLIATHVGGIPDIVGDSGTTLVRADAVDALTVAVLDGLAAPDLMHQRAAALRQRIRSAFSVPAMTDAVLDFYGTPGLLKAVGPSGVRRLHVQP